MFPRAKKSYSQNWLVDESVLETILNAAQIKPGDKVLEIGPGTGILTQALVDSGARVTAIEADHELIANLRNRFGDRVDLISGDILTANIPLLTKEASLGSPVGLRPRVAVLRPRGLGEVAIRERSYSVVANLPYSITSDVLKYFLTHRRKPSRIVLMLQREVVDRITAKPGDMSLLSIVCQLYAHCEKIADVPRGAFHPIPKVDSAIVRLDVIQDGSDREREDVIGIAKAGFSSPRKQLHGNLARSLKTSSARVKEALAQLGVDPKVRAESLRVDQWILLTHKLATHKPKTPG